MENENLAIMVGFITEDSSVETLSALLNDSGLIDTTGFQTGYKGGAKHGAPLAYQLPEFAQAILPEVEKVDSSSAGKMLKSIVLSANNQLIYWSAIN